MMLKWLFTISILLLCVSPVSAMEVFNIKDVSSGNFTAGDDCVYTAIYILNADPELVSHFIVDSDTYTFEANITYLNSFSSEISTSFYSKMTGNTSTYNETWYHILFFDDLYFELGSGNYDIQGTVHGGVRVSRLLSDEIVFAPKSFSIISDHPVDVRFYEAHSDDLDPIDLSGTLFELIKEVPFIGEYIYQILSIIRAIISTFIIFACILLKNWSLFFVLFESFVFFHATSIAQNKRGKSSALITESFKVIASDNKLLLDLLVSVFTQIINMFVGAVRMFRG